MASVILRGLLSVLTAVQVPLLMDNSYSALEIDLMLGLDDLAHNRLYSSVNGKMQQVNNYGRRNKNEKCYCKELKRLRIKR